MCCGAVECGVVLLTKERKLRTNVSNKSTQEYMRDEIGASLGYEEVFEVLVGQ
jgi:hypothetical protein